MMQPRKNGAIGGYQELELPLYRDKLMRPVIKTNSARSAINLTLRSIDTKKVWLPRYTCDAVIEAVSSAGVNFEFYRLESTFDVDITLQLKEDEHILVIDYFGLCGEVIKCSVNRFGNRRTIVDCSQAYFSDPVQTLACIYSPRKFFGLPDGGLLYSDDNSIQQPEARDSSSESRMGHLISRLTNSPEAGYQQYMDAEHALSKLPVLGMSYLTERLLKSIDYEQARSARAENANYLHAQLERYNQLKLSLDNSEAPLCYPFLPNVKTANRGQLINHRVFVPNYWPEVLSRVEEGSFEWDLVTNGLFLPCDQRYNKHDMDRLIGQLAIN